jgi:hypothetical protein
MTFVDLNQALLNTEAVTNALALPINRDLHSVASTDNRIMRTHIGMGITAIVGLYALFSVIRSRKAVLPAIGLGSPDRAPVDSARGLLFGTVAIGAVFVLEARLGSITVDGVDLAYVDSCARVCLCWWLVPW